MTENEKRQLAIGIAQMETISAEIKKINKHIEETNYMCPVKYIWKLLCDIEN